MRLKHLLLFVFAFLLFVLTSNSVLAATFKVTISNSNSYDLIDYQVRIDLSSYLTSATNLKVYDANNTLLNFCYEQSNGECGTTPTTVIWVKVPLIPANGDTIIYITESSANYAVNGDQVFDFYDDFNDGVLDTSKWTIKYVGNSSGFAVSETGGYVQLTAPGGVSGAVQLWSNVNFVNNFIVEGRWMFVYEERYHDIGIGQGAYTGTTYWHGVMNYGYGFLAQTPVTGSAGYPSEIARFDSSTITILQTSGTWASLGVWYDFEITYRDNGYFSVEITEGSALKTLLSTTDTTYLNSIKYVILHQGGYSGLSTGGATRFDWIRVRKISSGTISYNIEVISYSVQIINKRNVEFINLVNVTVNITNGQDFDVNTTIYYLLNNSVVFSKNVTLLANSYLIDSYVYEILKEDTYEITVELFDPQSNQNVSDSFVFTLDLYDENVTYSNYTTYNSSKYVDTLAYTISVRCGALNYNVTVDAWNSKSYTIVCDNTTKTVSDSWRPSSEGAFNTSFYLNAVDSADSRYFGNDTFIADLQAPTITYSLGFYEGYRTYAQETINVTCTDAVSPVCYCDIIVNDVSYFSQEQTNGTVASYNYNPYTKQDVIVACKDLADHTTSQTETIYRKFYFGECSSGQILTVNVFDEDTRSSLSANATLTFYNDNNGNQTQQQLSFAGASSKTYCVYPKVNNAEATTDIVISAEATNYGKRTYFVLDWAPTSARDVDIYLLASANAMPVGFRVVDQTGQSLSGYYIIAKRLMGSNYVAVAMGQTGANGETTIYLRPYDTYYQLDLLDPNGTLVKVYSPSIFSTSVYEDVYVLIVTAAKAISFIKGLAYEFVYNNSTGIVRATIQDTNNLLQKACLDIYVSAGIRKVKIDSVCETTSSGGVTITYNITQLNVKSVEVVLTANDVFLDSMQILVTEGIEAKFRDLAMLTGMISVSAGIGLVGFGVAGAIGAIFLALLPLAIWLTWGEMQGIVAGIFILFGLLLYKLRK